MSSVTVIINIHIINIQSRRSWEFPIVGWESEDESQGDYPWPEDSRTDSLLLQFVF